MKTEIMHCFDKKWRVYKHLPRCPTCGHDPDLMECLTSAGFATEEEAKRYEASIRET